jgi:GNAT superfamily N-acetyltransferase
VSASLREIYEHEMRRCVGPPPGRRREDDGVLTRIVGPSPSALDHMVFHSRLTAGTADAVIAAEVATARRLGHGMQWNVYDDDEPRDLLRRLSSAGFYEQASETVLVLPSDDPRLRHDPPAGTSIRRVTRTVELEDYFAVERAVWGTAYEAWVMSWFVPVLEGRADPAGIFIAYAGDVPVGVGWLTLPPGRTFAHLFGGTVLPAHRGRGVYRALVSARARLAAEHGLRFLVTDANSRSEPVLRRLGFEPMARRIEMVWAPPEATAAESDPAGEPRGLSGSASWGEDRPPG